MFRRKAFVCSRDELATLLPGWGPALPRTPRAFVNPFTGGPAVFSSSEPDEPDEETPEEHGSFDELPGKEVSWTPRDVATVAALLDGSSEVAFPGAAALFGPGGQKVFDVDASIVPRLAKLHEPLRDFAERVSRYSSDMGHANEHGEGPKLTAQEYAELPLDTIRSRTHRLEDLDPRGRARWQKRLDTWYAALEELVSLAPTVGAPGKRVYCVVWSEPD